MDLRALKDFQSTVTGNVSAGQILRGISDLYARQLIDWGMAEDLDPVKKPDSPADGQGKPSASSPAAPASPKRNVITSEQLGGARSPSTPATDSHPGATSSTPPTEPGGTKTTRKPRKPRSGGRKTGTPT